MSSGSSSSSAYDYYVGGTLTPDATGYYSVNGTFEGNPAYERVGGGYWLWFDSGVHFNYGWSISVSKGDDVNVWNNGSVNILGDPYYPVAPPDVTGNASVIKA